MSFNERLGEPQGQRRKRFLPFLRELARIKPGVVVGVSYEMRLRRLRSQFDPKNLLVLPKYRRQIGGEGAVVAKEGGIA